MSSIIYITNKKTGNKYAYESFSFRDPETKKPKTRRVYLGRIDPDTGVLIPKAPKGKRNRSISTIQRRQINEEAQQQIDVLTEQVRSLKKDVLALSQKNQASEKLIQTILKAVDKYQNSIDE